MNEMAIPDVSILNDIATL
uniref:Uncharacterized protein n=1 Tax=Anguilla anguilla TaxID=7936 RepID=A0A0E9R4J4_ANGAN